MRCLVTVLLVAVVMGAAGCSYRSGPAKITDQSNTFNRLSDVPNCDIGRYEASLSWPSGALDNVSIGTSVRWRVEVTGSCEGISVSLLLNDGSRVDIPSGIYEYQTSYQTVGPKTEAVSVELRKSNGQVVGWSQLVSPPFQVSPRVACRVDPSDAVVSGPATNGVFFPELATTFNISSPSSETFRLIEVLEMGSAVSPDRLNVSLPTALSTVLSVGVKIRSIGTKNYEFRVRTASSVEGVCTASGTANASGSAVNPISSFSVNPFQLSINQSVRATVTLGASLPSVIINGETVNVTGNTASRDIVVTSTGRVPIRVEAAQWTSETFVLSNPLCSLEAVTLPTSLPGNLLIRFDVTGGITSGTIQGNGIQTTSVGPFPNGVTRKEQEVQLSVATTTVKLEVFGPDGTRNVCETNIAGNFATVRPAVSLNASLNPVPVTSTVEVSLSSQNAENCEVLRDGVVISNILNGPVASLTNFLRDTTFSARCTNSVGSTDSNTLSLRAEGKWFSVNAEPCISACSRLGLLNEGDPYGGRVGSHGYKCASGEQRPRGVVSAGIPFRFGCGGNCTETSGSSTSSVGGFCYDEQTYQPWDSDQTDKTVACYCHSNP